VDPISRTSLPSSYAATLDTIDASTVMHLPEEASRLLPSRGQVAVQGSMNGHEFRTVLEPDDLRPTTSFVGSVISAVGRPAAA